MKVDEFVTVYKLLTEQSFYTLPFCILSIAGFLYFLSGLFSKGLYSITKNSIIIYCILLTFSLIIVIYKKETDENLRKDALRIKQYYIMYGGDYEALSIKTIINNVNNINEKRIDEVVSKFPNDFVYAQQNSKSNKLLILNDSAVANPLQKRLENLVYLKLKSNIDVNKFISFEALQKDDIRLTYRLIETVCSQHPDEFIVQRDINKPNSLSWVIIKRVKQ